MWDAFQFYNVKLSENGSTLSFSERIYKNRGRILQIPPLDIRIPTPLPRFILFFGLHSETFERLPYQSNVVDFFWYFGKDIA